MQDGRRLENLSWRVWNRETFCCASPSTSRPARRARTSSALSSRPTNLTDSETPALSSSLDSVSTVESEATADCSSSLSMSEVRPELRRPDMTQSAVGRGREKHITALDLQNFVQSIRETPVVKPIDICIPAPVDATIAEESPDAEELSKPEATMVPTLLESSTTLTEGTSTTNDTNPSQSFGSDESSATEISTHSIIRGFVPGGAPSSYRSQTNLAAQPTPILKRPTASQNVPKKKGPVFTIGTSSGEDESSLDSHMYKSSLSESLRRSPVKGPVAAPATKKQTSFREELAVARNSPVFESDDEDEEGVSESAIEEDDDSSDWEDSDDQSGPSSVNEKELFQRVDSRPNLTSRRSLLTTLMHEPDRAKALAQAAARPPAALRRSRTTTPNGPSIATSLEHGAHFSTAQSSTPFDHGTQSRPIVMNSSSSHGQQLALSPRTTRRNMLSTELTESLRKNLLWERQHRSTGNLAALKRRHTSHEVKNLKQHPEPTAVMLRSHKDFSNEYFHAGLQEFHNNGW